LIDGRDDRNLLAAARRGLSPTAADRDRVRRATLAALAPAGTAAGGESAGAAAEAAPAPGHAVAWATRLVAVGVVAATAAGVAGYRAGVRAGREQAVSERPAEVVPLIVAPEPPLAPVVDEPNRARATAPPAASVPLAGAPPVSRTAVRRRANAGAVAPTDIAAVSSASLAEEVRALRAVERALREGTPGFALSLLRELDRNVPNGRLMEERLATYTIARCASGDVPLGVSLAEDFVDRHPGSVYARRVADACAGTDSSRAGHSVGGRSPR